LKLTTTFDSELVSDLLGHPVHKKESLLETVDWERDGLEKIKGQVTAEALLIDENPLLLAMKVTF